MKILLFGGAFDPPHLGHIAILKSALKCEDFDRAVIMPTGTPTHKKGCTAPFEVRKFLCETAFCPLSPIVEISDYEGVNFKQDYTLFTIQYLKESYENAEIYMLIGGDSLINLKTWYEFKDVIKQCRILSFARQENEEPAILKEVESLKKLGAQVRFVKSTVTPVSSSDIRSLEKSKEGAAGLVNPETKSIIDEYNIYNKDDYTRLCGTARLLIKLLLDEKRQKHTYNVEKLAVELGEKYGLNTQKLSLAALYHDIMKNMPQDILLHRAQQSDIIEKINAKALPVLHGYAAADYVKKELGISDEEILTALKSHTCARADMQDFEKVLYLADMLCEERRFDGKDQLLKIAFESLDIAMEKSLEQTITWLKQNNKIIDKDSAQALAYFKARNK
ncbi:MAG: bis(5'-nucleosyl)-tetraphosphatase (symmetrical) YqeK [Oscillospiraceae bacterium]